MIRFVDLPAEIRLMIYRYSLKPNRYVRGYRRIMAYEPEYGPTGGPSCMYPRPYVERSTPPILLLNKQITKEALEVLYRIPLDLHPTPSPYFTMRQMDIAEFISEHLLQRMHYCSLYLPGANKNFVLTILDIWGQGNQLKRLDVFWPKSFPSYNERHWKVVRSRILTFAAMVPTIFHEVDQASKPSNPA
ncbi:hypothetical protein N7512_002619 [Penicillium capsulatum]|nr:hypothetical protein N7512_002619 [Penicillium capsulatum]